jgi:hypothetical protein
MGLLSIDDWDGLAPASLAARGLQLKHMSLTGCAKTPFQPSRKNPISAIPQKTHLSHPAKTPSQPSFERLCVRAPLHGLRKNPMMSALEGFVTRA